MLPTVAGSWTVRDVVAHLIDGQIRRLSSQRDGQAVPSPPGPVAGYESLVAYLNELNAEWVGAMRRMSPPQLFRFIDATGREYADFLSTLDPDGMASFPVAWAGDTAWRLLFNALDPSKADEEILAAGDPVLISRFLEVRGVMV